MAIFVYFFSETNTRPRVEIQDLKLILFDNFFESHKSNYFCCEESISEKIGIDWLNFEKVFKFLRLVHHDEELYYK